MIKPLFRVLLGLVCEDLNDAFIQTSSRNTLRFFNCFLHCFKLAKSLKLGHEQAGNTKHVCLLEICAGLSFEFRRCVKLPASLQSQCVFEISVGLFNKNLEYSSRSKLF